jgi:hypothetical protein
MDAAGFPRLENPDRPAASLERQTASQPFGRGPFNTAVGALVMAFVPHSTRNQGQHGAILAWVPKDQAATAEDAKEFLQARLEAAFAWALRDTDLKGARYTFEAAIKNLGGKTRAVVLRGGPCAPAMPYGFMPFVSSTLKLTETRAPPFLPHDRSWATQRPGNPPALEPWTPMGNEPVARFPEVEVYRKASAFLPPWVFIYIAAGSASSCEPSSACRLVEHSFVLSRGQAYPL